MSSALPPGKTGHLDEAFVKAIFVSLSGLFKCTEEQLMTDYCFHNVTSTVCRNKDGTFSIKAVTRVGLTEAVRAWFGKWSMSFGHSSVHANPFGLHRATEDPRISSTCLSFGIHRLCDLATDVLHRQSQGGKKAHTNNFLVATEEVPLIFLKEGTHYVKGGTFCVSFAMVTTIFGLSSHRHSYIVLVFDCLVSVLHRTDTRVYCVVFKCTCT